MAYIPKDKYKVLYTNGNKYKLVGTSKPYIGKYIKLNNGKLFAGEHPNNVLGALKLLRTSKNKNIRPGKNNNIYSILKPKLALIQDNYIPIPSTSPTPNALDYSKGYFNRYLSVRLNTKQYQEISQITFKNFNTNNYNKSLNKVFQIEWSLNGNNEDLNIKILRNLEYQLPGIFNFFPNKSQFGLKYGVVKVGKVSRIYPMGEAIPAVLPAAYQTGNTQINTIDNPNVPTHQHCGNCIFNQEDYCNKWQANIKKQYWCRSYKVKVNSKPSGISKELPPPSLLPTLPPTPQQQPTSPLRQQISPLLQQQNTQNTTPSRGGGGY